ncbi:MAG: PIN domain-containing protein [Gaiella sp.]|nr:PIN domain-containing protein [Gaiella sp.]
MIFVDTSVFVAVIASRDAHHGEAVELLRTHGTSSLVTSNHVRGETWTALDRRYGHRIAARFLDLLDRTRHLGVVTVGAELEAQALRWLRRHDERAYSFVDATSFAWMRSERVAEVLTFDEGFGAAGFVTLRA